MRRLSSIVFLAAVPALCLMGFLGCSEQDGPTRYRVSGTVRLNGKPAPVFEIFFRPDTAQGGSGPGAVVKGREGTYEIPARKGVSVGPYQVDIVAFDGIANEESKDGNALTTKTYTTTVSIPSNDSEQNFDVPASHLVDGRR